MSNAVIKKLNHQQSRFCLEYLKDYNATQAAIRAKYSKRTASEQAYDLLRKPQIQEEILKREREIQNRITVTKEKIMKEMAIIGFESCVNSFTAISRKQDPGFG